ncbi:hypothetical protein D3C78_1617860 [compost metagenome]
MDSKHKRGAEKNEKQKAACAAVNLGACIQHNASSICASAGWQEEGAGLHKLQNGAIKSRYAEGLDRPYDMDKKLHCQRHI